jgi:hypothetical protein
MTRVEVAIDTRHVDELFAEWDRSDSPGCVLGGIQQGELTYARLRHGQPRLERER